MFKHCPRFQPWETNHDNFYILLHDNIFSTLNQLQKKQSKKTIKNEHDNAKEKFLLAP